MGLAYVSVSWVNGLALRRLTLKLSTRLAAINPLRKRCSRGSETGVSPTFPSLRSQLGSQTADLPLKTSAHIAAVKPLQLLGACRSSQPDKIPHTHCGRQSFLNYGPSYLVTGTPFYGHAHI